MEKFLIVPNTTDLIPKDNKEESWVKVKTRPYEKEIEKVDIPEIQEDTKHPGIEEFSLNRDNFTPGRMNI